MAVPIPAVRYATQTWDLDGTEPNFEINFAGGYISQADVKAFSVLVDEETGEATDYTAHPVTFLSEADDSATLDIIPRPANGRRLVIYRDTPKGAPLVSYEDGAALTKRNLDLQNMQAIFAIAEIVDGLRDSQVLIGETVSNVVETETLINQIYEQVITLLEASGFITVAPVVYAFAFDGTQTDFPIASSVEVAGAYDLYVDGKGVQPGIGYTVLPGDTPDEKVIRFLGTPPAAGLFGFAVLRGYSRPFTEEPITTLAPAVQFITNNTTVDGTRQNTLFVSTSSSDITVTIRKDTGAENDWVAAGKFFSVLQYGTGRVTLVAEDGSVIPSPQFQPVTRGYGSMISAQLLDPENNVWAAAGDLDRDASLGSIESFVVAIGDLSTEVATATNKESFRAPFAFALTEVRLELRSAQSSGTKFTVDVKANGVSVFTTPISVDNGETTSVTAAVPYVLDVANSTIPDNAVVSFDIIGAGAGGLGPKCTLTGNRV